eukprot:TRINITY_DN8036_c0_g1_i1.p1 TRINITY_DN8036_c0_g1~~TRINITY_DN8036_c0_g1_i1.p1  ORF type:complete len:103 (+),score=1.27 TRINITY_DN8036_c0_g1_i1:186-494(+)
MSRVFGASGGADSPPLYQMPGTLFDAVEGCQLKSRSIDELPWHQALEEGVMRSLIRCCRHQRHVLLPVAVTEVRSVDLLLERLGVEQESVYFSGRSLVAGIF